MASIIVEDGSIVVNANSYVSEAELTTYASDRGITISGTKSILLIQAMDSIELEDFIGTKYTRDQPLMWPRSGVVLYGYSLDVNQIPDLLKEAQMELALAIDAGNNPLATQDRVVKREKVGPIDIEYDNSQNITPYLTAVRSKLSALVHGGHGNVVVSRA